jgi:AraC family transcriptional regulator
MSRPMSEGSGLFGRVSLMEIDRPVGTHAHPQCHALFKIDGDDSEFDVEGERYPMSLDTAVLVNAWQPHSYPFISGAQGRARVLALYVEPSWMVRVDPSFQSSARRDFFCEPCVGLPAALRRPVREWPKGAGLFSACGLYALLPNKSRRLARRLSSCGMAWRDRDRLQPVTAGGHW